MKKKEDFLINKDDITFVGEIKGLSSAVQNKNISQLEVHIQNYFDKLQEEGKEEKVIFSENTVIGALSKYISTPNERFQPMNANFGILPELEGRKIRDKKERYAKLAERSLGYFN